MTDHAQILNQLGWPDDLLLAACNNCGLSLLQPVEAFEKPCVHCGSHLIEEMDPHADRPPHLAPPELILPTQTDQKKAEKELSDWYRRFYFPPADLKLPALNQRMRLVYVPAWLMDTTLDSKWAADVGFDYDVISHQERYQGGNWSTKQVSRTQKDWEGRAGEINLHYENLPADAIEREYSFWPIVRLMRSGDRFLKQAVSYESETHEKGTYILPSRIPDDAVNDMLPTLMELAKHDVQQACRADHIRNFNWAPQIKDQNWTKLLIPIWSTWYLDEDERKRMVFLNGVTGQGWGEKIPSMKRTWRVGLYFLIVCIILILLGLSAGFVSGNWGVMTLATIIVLGLMFTFLLMAVYVIYQKNKEQFFGRF